MQYTNMNNIPLPLAVFLATDDYDYVPNTLSTTTLIRPIKQTILQGRLSEQDKVVDIASLINARMGTAIHTAIEKAWKDPVNALKALGYSDKTIQRIKINANPEDLKLNDIPVYMEQRSYKQCQGYTISGKFDFVANGQVQDFKSTSVYSYMNQSNADKYILQGSIYRWLNPDIITEDEMIIHYIFTDWSKANSNKEGYPQLRTLSQNYPLKSLHETEQYIRNRLNLINQYRDSDESQIPPCSDEDLWRSPTVYKYFKDPNAKRSTKNFDNKSDAYAHLHQTGRVGVIKEVKGQVSACKYCPAFAICQQKDELIRIGDLVV